MANNKESKSIIHDQERFDVLSSMFYGLNGEIVTFSRKKPDKIISEFQSKKINQVLEPLLDIMKDEPYAEFLELIPETSVEKKGRSEYLDGLTYGDVALIFSKYRSAIELYRKKNASMVIGNLHF